MKRGTAVKARLVNLDGLGPVVDTAGCWHFEEDFEIWFRNPEHGLVLVERGRIDAQLAQGLVRGRAGDLLYFPPVAQMSYRVRGPAVLYLAGMFFAPPPRHLHAPCFAEVGPLPARLPLGDAFPDMRALVETLCMEVPRAGADHRLRVRATVYQILALIAHVLSAAPSVRTPVDAWERVRLRLDSRLGHQLRIADLARELNLSPRYFQREFHRRFHVSPKTYQLGNRIGEVVRRLRESEAAFKVIAYEMGYRDPRILARAIRRHLGVGPSELRLLPSTALNSRLPHGAKPFPLNRFAVPPGTPANWAERYEPSSSRGRLPHAES